MATDPTGGAIPRFIHKLDAEDRAAIASASVAASEDEGRPTRLVSVINPRRLETGITRAGESLFVWRGRQGVEAMNDPTNTTNSNGVNEQYRLNDPSEHGISYDHQTVLRIDYIPPERRFDRAALCVAGAILCGLLGVGNLTAILTPALHMNTARWGAICAVLLMNAVILGWTALCLWQEDAAYEGDYDLDPDDALDIPADAIEGTVNEMRVA